VNNWEPLQRGCLEVKKVDIWIRSQKKKKGRKKKKEKGRKKRDEKGFT